MKSGRVVLVIDDDDDLRESVAMVLEEEGCEVHTAPDGGRALEMLRAGLRPRFILLDLMMPHVDGWRFREEQRADPRLRDIPVYVLTAHGNTEDVAKELAPKGVLKKPMGVEELLAAIDALLR